ncbi:hypothetical protein FDUTEX481_06993 [Tolypothrix sp. PCC 7601]|nr:hypothetical protein FDUTEX481_06993 [Tolypothrix sp. PCC 7601]BAY88362.1 hypothetical protein NIES3275_03370 [Microchaete diplosiphon NIES-3275]
MTNLLQEAFAVVSQLPEAEQNAISSTHFAATSPARSITA